METEPTSENMRITGADLDPFEINFLPQFERDGGPRQPFVNEFGVTIGDHDYASPQSPLENWSKDTDPFVMAGEQWVHPYKDIGFHSPQNRDYFERGIPREGSARFTHPYSTAAPVHNPGSRSDDEEGTPVE